MTKAELERRTLQFALDIIRLVSSLPATPVAKVLGYQLLKAGTSVGANYREANRAESRDDFIHKIGIVEKEAAESHYWLTLFSLAPLGNPEKVKALLQEANELTAIFVRIGKTAKANRRLSKSKR